MGGQTPRAELISATEGIMRKVVLALSVTLAVSACGQPTPDSTPSALNAPPIPEGTGTAAPPSAQRFTKAQFDNYVFGKSKAAIKAEFGPPDAVHDEDDSWVYYRLPIYDADAGIQTMVTITFSGLDGPTDSVASVRF